ncbi:MAG: FtsW/RodA/SpoVE family cell cycle protein, partial [Chloroflexi bacterium]|nr:FtsW/RodA/SpoVE family cell cycle protein [Chloroflexota bacterium]
MSRSTTSSPEFDYTLLVLVMGLIAFGLVMMFSASYSLAYYYTDNALYFFVRQLIWTALGLVGMFVMMNINYRFWQKAAIPIVALSLASLVLVLFVGNAEGGST